MCCDNRIINKDDRGWEKRKITRVFWKSYVTEFCEKWVSSRGNYAYTRFEKFCTCTGEIIFSNEHKAVFSKNEADYHIPIKSLNIFKDFSSCSKAIFKIKPINTKIIEIINAKKAKNVDYDCLKDYINTFGNVYPFLSNLILRAHEENDEILNLNFRCNIITKLEAKNSVLKKIKEKQDNLLDEIWNTYYKKCKQMMQVLTIFRMGFFGADHGWRGTTQILKC